MLAQLDQRQHLRPLIVDGFQYDVAFIHYDTIQQTQHLLPVDKILKRLLDNALGCHDNNLRSVDGPLYHPRLTSNAGGTAPIHYIGTQRIQQHHHDGHAWSTRGRGQHEQHTFANAGAYDGHDGATTLHDGAQRLLLHLTKLGVDTIRDLPQYLAVVGMFHCLLSTHLLVMDLGRNPIWTNLVCPSTPYIGLARRRKPQKSIPLDTNPTKPISFVYSVLEGLYYCPPIHLPTCPPLVGKLAVLEIVCVYAQSVLVVDHFLNPVVARVFTDDEFDDMSPRYDVDSLP